MHQYNSALKIVGFVFSDDALSSVWTMLQSVTHADLRSVSLLLGRIAYASVPVWPKLEQLRMLEPTVENVAKGVGRVAIGKFVLYWPDKVFTP